MRHIIIHIFLCTFELEVRAQKYVWGQTTHFHVLAECNFRFKMKGTKVLTLGAVGVYTPVFSRAIYLYVVALRMRKFVGVHNEYTYMRVHEKYACGTETQLPAS